jgi:hypothetical protein
LTPSVIFGVLCVAFDRSGLRGALQDQRFGQGIGRGELVKVGPPRGGAVNGGGCEWHVRQPFCDGLCDKDAMN